MTVGEIHRLYPAIGLFYVPAFLGVAPVLPGTIQVRLRRSMDFAVQARFSPLFLNVLQHSLFAPAKVREHVRFVSILLFRSLDALFKFPSMVSVITRRYTPALVGEQTTDGMDVVQ